jgi:mannonate dehydratase
VTRISRRTMLKTVGAAAAVSLPRPHARAASNTRAQRTEAKDTPKIALEMGLGVSPQGMGLEEAAAAAARRIRQLGVTHVLGGGPRIPWSETQLKELMERSTRNGLTLANLMISGFPNAIYARPDRDQDIDKVIQSIRAAGRVGVPVVEYNWYAHRAMEGYFEETGRAGAGWTGFDYQRMKDLPPLPEEGAHTLDEMWTNITYFLKAVVPEAEKAGIRLALHPNDPPAHSAAALSRSWARSRAGRSSSASSTARQTGLRSTAGSHARWAEIPSRCAGGSGHATASITCTSAT